MVGRLRRFFDLRPGEGRPLLFTFSYVAVAVGSFLLAKPIRSALFLEQFGAARLAYVYVGVSLVLALVVPVYSAIAGRVGQRMVITGSLLFLCANVLLFWWGLTFHPAPWMAAVFYVWVNCYGVIAPVQAWTFASSVFDTRQARRLFGLVGAGASFGAIVGGVLARTLVGPLGTINLLLVLAGLILLAVLIVNLAWRVRRHDRIPGTRRKPLPFRDNVRLIAKSPYLRKIAMLVALVAIVTQWTQFQFQAAVEQRFAAPAPAAVVTSPPVGSAPAVMSQQGASGGSAVDRVDQFTRFFGNFNSIMGVVTLLVQLLLTGRVLRKFGLAVTIVLLPLTLGGGVAAIWLTGALWAVVLTNAFDQGLRFSIDKATFELLYLPIGADVKLHIKSTIDLIVNRIADGIGGVLLGLVTTGFTFAAFAVPGLNLGLRGVAFVTLLLIVAWTAVAFSLRKGYVDAIRDSITQHSLDTTQTSAQVLDRSATQVLVARLGANEPQEILYALDVFRVQHRGAMHPAVRALLHHPAPEIRLRAISVLDSAGDTAMESEVEALLNDADPSVRAEALLFLAHHAEIDPLQRITTLTDFPDYSIQASLVAFLGRESTWQNTEAARVILRHMVEGEGSEPTRAKLEAARLLGQLDGTFAEELSTLLADDDEQVVRAALKAAGQPAHAGQLDRVVEHLGDSRFRDAAIEALGAMGPDAVSGLRVALEDRQRASAVRSEIPRALAVIGGAEAREALVENLLESDVALRAHIIAGLNRLHAKHPELSVDREAIEMTLGAEIMGHYRSYQILGTLGSTFDSRDTVAQALGNAIEQEQERIFRLLAPLQPDTDMKSVFVALRSSNRTLRANAAELLDNVLSPRLRERVVPLFDGQYSTADRVKLANRHVGASVDTPEQAALAMIASEDDWLKACGVYAAGNLRLQSLRPRIEALVESPDPLLRETARAALARLEPVSGTGPRAKPPAPPPAEPPTMADGSMGVG